MEQWPRVVRSVHGAVPGRSRVGGAAAELLGATGGGEVPRPLSGDCGCR